MDDKNLVGRDGRRKSEPRVPIVEPTDGHQWVPPTLACPFLEQGERSFIERFVKVEVGLQNVTEGFVDMKKTLRNAVIAIICSVVGSITFQLWKSAHEFAERPVAATQGARK